MECIITQGYKRKCKDNQGGISKVYLFPYVKYRKSEIITQDLTIISFPTTTLFEFSVLDGASLSQNMTSDDGGKYYNQSISLQFARIKDTVLFEKLLKKDYRIIIQDNNGKYRLMGAYNGVEATSVTTETGGSKSDFNGVKVDFEAKEIKESLFIEDLQNAGFEIYETSYLLLEDEAYLLLETGDKILL